MRAIKTLVVFLGVLLLAGLGLLGYGLYSKAPVKGTPSATSGAMATASAAEFGQLAVPVPAGSRVEQMVVAGERVVLRLSGGGSERILVLDPGQGKVAGGFVLTPEPAVR
ncbi:hypothetical protein H261_12436 [Paramagnetospirillum caucaseum]|uniref:Uncharacterized protein n=1 Tax=Paramagnetospirillum caucaseum TaxID=1244869 RepID=M3AA60_9PROT|nr:hypothetical protein [Paramagnetospirillum caucaseum]EME69633.1 hypothetical protein H261_12436 [Paramagnetospirillum caucaseum]